MGKCRYFSRAYKLEVLLRIEESGLSCSRVSLDLGLDPSVVRRWRRQLSRKGSDVFPGSGYVRSSEAAYRTLEKENARLRMENEILKRRRPFSGSSEGEVRFYPGKGRPVPGGADVQIAGCFPQWVLRVVGSSHQPSCVSEPGAGRGDGADRAGLSWCVWQSSHASVVGARGYRCSRNRVARLMRKHGIRAARPRGYRSRTTRAAGEDAVAPNVLDRRFEVGVVHRAWVADITYIPTEEGWLYLAAVLDLGSRYVVGGRPGIGWSGSFPCAAWPWRWSGSIPRQA